MRLTRAIAAIGVLLGLASPAMAQSGCGGQFPANTVCVNPGPSQGIPGPGTVPAGSLTPIAAGTVLANPTAATAAPIATSAPIVIGATTTSPGYYAQITGDTFPRVRVGLNSTDVASVAFGPGNAARDSFIERVGAGSLRLGAPDAAAPVAQTLGVQNVVAGTSNTAGANLTINGSRGTGTGIGGDIIFQTAPAGSSGTAQNALAGTLTISHLGYPTASTAAFGTNTTQLATTAFVQAAIAAPASVTLYVNHSIGVDTGLCTNSGSPCATIQYASQVIQSQSVRSPLGFSAFPLIQTDCGFTETVGFLGTGEALTGALKVEGNAASPASCVWNTGAITVDKGAVVILDGYTFRTTGSGLNLINVGKLGIAALVNDIASSAVGGAYVHLQDGGTVSFDPNDEHGAATHQIGDTSGSPCAPGCFAYYVESDGGNYENAGVVQTTMPIALAFTAFYQANGTTAGTLFHNAPAGGYFTGTGSGTGSTGLKYQFNNGATQGSNFGVTLPGFSAGVYSPVAYIVPASSTQNSAFAQSITNVSTGTTAAAGYTMTNANDIGAIEVAGSLASGLVNATLQNRLYAYAGPALSGIELYSDGAHPICFHTNSGTKYSCFDGTTGQLDLGQIGSQAGGILFANATSGTIALVPATGALGTQTITLPAATGTVALTSGANVASVSNSDGTLTISPTTGAVVASLNTAHANTISALWTFNTGDLAVNGGTATAGIATVSSAGVLSSEAVVPVANGGTNCSSASITCFNNITGLSAAGTTGTTSTNLVFSTSPTFVTPALGAATGTTLALGGCTLSASVFCITGSAVISASLTTGVLLASVASGNAFAVGPNGLTNPTLLVDTSTTSDATGLKIKGAAAGGGLALSVITSGTNENLTIDAASAGTVTINGTATGAITLSRATTASVSISSPIHTASGALTFQSNGSTFAGDITTGQQWFMGATLSAPPTGPILTVSKNAAALPTTTIPDTANGQVLAIGGVDSSNASMMMYAFGTGNTPAVRYLQSRGTAASQTATQSTDIVGANFGYGYTSSNAYVAAAGFVFTATNNFTSALSGTRVDIYATPTGGTGIAVGASIGAGLMVGTTTDPGAGSIQINAQQFIPNITTSSAAQNGTVCWTTGTGKLTVDTTVGCLSSLMGAKNIMERLSPKYALDIIDQLSPFSFRYKKGWGDGGRYEQFGLGAEEVATVDERLVGRDPQGVLQGVRYQELAAVLAGAIKELKADNDNLRHELHELKRNRK